MVVNDDAGRLGPVVSWRFSRACSLLQEVRCYTSSLNNSEWLAITHNVCWRICG
jgi:hypothetical protein